MGRPIGKRVEDAIVARLSDLTHGLNQWITTLAPDYAQDADEMTFDFSSDSTQFFVGIQATSDLLEDENVTFPNLSLVIVRSANENLTKGPTGIFSGTVTAQMYLILSWPTENALARISDRANCYEESLYGCFCNNQPTLRWVPGDGLIFARDMAIARGPVVAGAENLSQMLTITMPFELEAR